MGGNLTLVSGSSLSGPSGWVRVLSADAGSSGASGVVAVGTGAAPGGPSGAARRVAVLYWRRSYGAAGSISLVVGTSNGTAGRGGDVM